VFYFWLHQATSLLETFLHNLKTVTTLRPVQSPCGLHCERGARDGRNACVSLLLAGCKLISWSASAMVWSFYGLKTVF